MRNDPSAGSPTDALLRLLFPLNHPVRLSFHSVYMWVNEDTHTQLSNPSNSQRSSSVRATGGVYKGQGRIPSGMLNQRLVQGIPSWDRDQQLTVVCPHRELTIARTKKNVHTHKPESLSKERETQGGRVRRAWMCKMLGKSLLLIDYPQLSKQAFTNWVTKRVCAWTHKTRDHTVSNQC